MLLRKLTYLFYFLILSFASGNGFGQVRFLTSHDEAFFRAKRTQRPLLIFFTTKSCEQCKMVESILLNDSLVGQILNENFIALKMDESSRIIKYLDKFEVEAFPTLTYVKPNEQRFHHLRSITSSADIIENTKYALELYKGYFDFLMDLDTITNLTSLNLLMLDYIRFNPDDDIFYILNEAATKSPSLRDKLFKAIPSKLNYGNLYSVFIEDNSIFFENDKLRDALVHSFYRLDKKPLNRKTVSELSNYFLGKGFTNLEESIAYIKILQSFEEQILASKLGHDFTFSLTNLKDFMMTYPHCHDKQVTSECFKMLAARYKSKNYYQKLYGVVKEKLLETPDDFMLYDIMSVCQYIIGQKEVAIKTLIKANELAFQSNVPYSPSLKALRD